MSDKETVTIPKYYYDALLLIAHLADERAVIKEQLYKKEQKLNTAIFSLKRPELEEEAK